MKLKSILLTAVITLTLAAETMAQVPNYVPTNGLVGWWPFNGNANDESGNGNNGTVNGAALISDRFGNSSKAYSFDGINDFINIPNSSSLDITGPISVNAWVNLNDTLTYNNIISKDNDLFPDRSWFFGVNYNRIELGIFNPGQNDFENYSNQYNFHLNWAMVSFTYDLDSIRLYVNSILQQTRSYNSNLVSTNEPLKIGVMDEINNSHWFLKGKVDDIGMWNRALTQQEVTELYNGNICYQTVTVTDTLLINMGITGFNPITYNNTIKIFPNPTNDHITIDYGNFTSLNGYQLKIINSLSQQVFQTNITQQSNYLDLTSWGGNGLYFFQIIDPQGNITDIKKIVLQ